MAKLHEWYQVADGRAKGAAERQRRDRFLKGKKHGR